MHRQRLSVGALCLLVEGLPREVSVLLSACPLEPTPQHTVPPGGLLPSWSLSTGVPTLKLQGHRPSSMLPGDREARPSVLYWRQGFVFSVLLTVTVPLPRIEADMQEALSECWLSEWRGEW